MKGIPWGIAADRWGRKRCLMLSMLNVAILGIAFGLSTNFWMALFSRFMIGLGNGFMGIAKVCSCSNHIDYQSTVHSSLMTGLRD
jgi:MFS family permease